MFFVITITINITVLVLFMYALKWCKLFQVYSVSVHYNYVTIHRIDYSITEQKHLNKTLISVCLTDCHFQTHLNSFKPL